MSTLSFVPRYHELILREGQPCWTPTDNPSQECVQVERQRIEHEGAAVQTNPAVLESLQHQPFMVEQKHEDLARETTKRERKILLTMALIGAAMLLTVVYMFGSQLLAWMCPAWVASLNGVVAMLVETAVGALVMAPAGAFVVRRFFRVETK